MGNKPDEELVYTSLLEDWPDNNVSNITKVLIWGAMALSADASEISRELSRASAALEEIASELKRRTQESTFTL